MMSKSEIAHGEGENLSWSKKTKGKMYVYWRCVVKYIKVMGKSKIARNDCGGKGRTYKPFIVQNISCTRGGRKDGKCVLKNSTASRGFM